MMSDEQVREKVSKSIATQRESDQRTIAIKYKEQQYGCVVAGCVVSGQCAWSVHSSSSLLVTHQYFYSNSNTYSLATGILYIFILLPSSALSIY